MAVYATAPSPPLDPGMVFIRDADFDGVSRSTVGGVWLFVSDRYDFEMDLLPGRIFDRIMAEYLKRRAEASLIEDGYAKIEEAAAHIGAMRRLAADGKWPVKFDEMELRFVQGRDLQVDVTRMVNYFLQRSCIKPQDLGFTPTALEELVLSVVASTEDKSSIASGKDFIQIMSIALHKTFRACTAAECQDHMLARVFRITCNLDDLRQHSIWPEFVSHIQTCGFEWTGAALS